MKKALILLVLLAALVAVFLLVFRGGSNDPEQTVQGLPWQIEILPDGESRVFGVTLGRSTLGEAAQQLGGSAEVAIVVNNEQDYGLEMFFSHYTAGVFSGKLILVADLPAERIEQLVQRAARRKYLDSGGKKYRPAHDDLPGIMSATVKNITFLPSVSLDEEAAIDRFGVPAERVVSSEQQVHLLYPDQGLDIIITRKGRDVLQYVAPKSFSNLRDPLRQDSAGEQ